MSTGRIICVGLGPGDPDLMTVRAHRLVTEATHIAYFRKAGRPGQARRIVDTLLRPDVTEVAMEYPVTTELPHESPLYNALLSTFYDHWTRHLASLAQTKDVIVLCEGDPFFYGSFMHLHTRLHGLATVEIVPGITAMSGCWTATGTPITWRDDVLTILTGILPEPQLIRRMQDSDALVIMKTGRNLAKIRRALSAAGRLDQAWLVIHATTPQQRVLRLSETPEDACPYFATVLVHGKP